MTIQASSIATADKKQFWECVETFTRLKEWATARFSDGEAVIEYRLKAEQETFAIAEVLAPYDLATHDVLGARHARDEVVLVIVPKGHQRQVTATRMVRD